VSRLVVAAVAVAAAFSTAGCDLVPLFRGGGSTSASVGAKQSRDDGYYACLNLPPGIARDMHDPKRARRTAGSILTMLSQTFPNDDPRAVIAGCAAELHVRPAALSPPRAEP
jgi:hypothetical protein